MKTFIIIINTLFLLSFTVFSCTAQTNEPTQKEVSIKAIDGQTFYIESFMPNGSSVGREYIYFKNQSIAGSECVKYGYDSPPYKIDNKGNITASMHSEQEGQLSWNGTIENGIFSGKARWKKDGQDDIMMTFKGSLVKE